MTNASSQLSVLSARPVRTRRLLAGWGKADPVWSDVDARRIAEALTGRGSWPLLVSLARLTQAGDGDAPVWLAAALVTHPAVKAIAGSCPVDDVVQAVIVGLLESKRSITGVRSILDCARTTRRRNTRWSERTAPLPHTADLPHIDTASVSDPFAVIDLRASLDPTVLVTVEARALGYTCAEIGQHHWAISRQLKRAQHTLTEPALESAAAA